MAKWSDEVIDKKSEEFAQIADLYSPLSTSQLEREYQGWYEKKEELAFMVKDCNKRLMVMDALLTTRMSEDDLRTLKLENGHSFTLTFEPAVSIENAPVFIAWMKSSGREGELTVHARTATRIAKEELDESGQLPAGMKQGDPIPKITYRRR